MASPTHTSLLRRPATPEPAPEFYSGRRTTAHLTAPGRLPWFRQVSLFTGVFVLLLLAGSREPPWNDAKMIHGVAEAIAERGTVALPHGVPHAGKFYGIHPLLPSLVHVPGAWLHQKIATAWPKTRERSRVFTSHLGSAAAAALAVLMFAQLCRELGASTGVAGFAGLVLVLGTIVGVYGRLVWSEIVQVACFVACYRYLLRVVSAPTAGVALAVGLWAGLLVNSKVIYFLGLPPAGLYVAYRIWRQYGPGALARAAGWVLLGALPGVALLLGYNLVRTGALFSTGYNVGAASARTVFNERLLFGLHGLFFSLGKSVFLYSPPLIAAVLAFPFVVRSTRFSRDWLWLGLLLSTPPLFVYARFAYWSGDWAWGPRYAVFLSPVLLIPGVLGLELALETTSRLRRWLARSGAAVALALGLFVQVLGGIFYWDHFIRLAQAGQYHWLGRPNRAGAMSPVRRDGRCDPCFEDFLTFNHLPAFQPIEGHLWAARHVLRGHPWPVAELDAPWRRYTSLSMPLGHRYAGFRADWWALDWTKARRSARYILAAGGVLLGVAAALWYGDALAGAARRRWRRRQL